MLLAAYSPERRAAVSPKTLRRGWGTGETPKRQVSGVQAGSRRSPPSPYTPTSRSFLSSAVSPVKLDTFLQALDEAAGDR